MAELADKYEEVSEQLVINKLHLTDNKRKHLEQRAKISLVNGVIPLIDRMLHEIEKLKRVAKVMLCRQNVILISVS